MHFCARAHDVLDNFLDGSFFDVFDRAHDFLDDSLDYFLDILDGIPVTGQDPKRWRMDQHSLDEADDRCAKVGFFFGEMWRVDVQQIDIIL